MKILIEVFGWILIFTCLGFNLGVAYYEDGIGAKVCAFVAGILTWTAADLICHQWRK